jgi:FAD/FMN-containing dehydrogenase
MTTHAPTDLPLDALASIVGAAQVSIDPALRRLVSDDVFPWDDAPLVAVVVSPATTAEVAAVVRLADAQGIAVAPRGGGVSYTRGYVPLRERTLLLDFSRMSAVHEINADDRYATVGPGCTWQQLDEACAKHGLRPAMRGPISGSHATVCGSVAQNTGSASMAAILALEVVVADGRIVHTGSSAVAAHPAPFLRNFGPDLAGLFIGDSGALGIKTACTLALEPLPAGHAFASLAFESLAAMTQTMIAVSRSGIPSRLLGMDPLKNRTATRVGVREGLGTLAQVVRSAGSVAAGLRQAASA